MLHSNPDSKVSFSIEIQETEGEVRTEPFLFNLFYPATLL